MIYLFPGLAASGKLFRDYDLSPHPSQTIDYLIPERKESLRHYCRRMADRIEPGEENIYIGVSFGGLLAQEISRIVPAEKVIIISSIKSRKELPLRLRWLNYFPLHRMMPAAWIKKLVVLASELLTVKSEYEKKFFRELVDEADSRVIQWGISQMIRWQQQSPESGVIHFHGDSDPVLPISRIRADHVIRGGVHFMIMRNVKEIEKLIMEELNKPVAAIQ